MGSITLKPFDIFFMKIGIHIYKLYIYQVKFVCRVHEWLLPLAALLSNLPLNDL